MRAKVFLFAGLALFLSVSLMLCPAANATAEELFDESDYPLVAASGSFDVYVPANSSAAVGSSFPLEAGDVVSIRASYSPFAASVDFGLIAPDGLFYGLNANNGSFDDAIQVNQRGHYTFAIRNHSSNTVHALGCVDY